MVSQTTPPSNSDVSANEFQEYLRLMDREIARCHRFNKTGALVMLGWCVVNVLLYLFPFISSHTIYTPELVLSYVVLVIPLIFHLDSMSREFRLQVAKEESCVLFKNNCFARDDLTVAVPTTKPLTLHEYLTIYRRNKRYVVPYILLFVICTVASITN